MDLDELLGNMRGWEIEDAPGYADQIAQIVGDIRSGSDAALAEVNAALEAKDAEIQRLQAENYKLMSAVGSAAGEDDSATDDASDPEPDEENAPVDDVTDYVEEEDE